jgi:hypothetical protein
MKRHWIILLFAKPTFPLKFALYFVLLKYGIFEPYVCGLKPFKGFGFLIVVAARKLRALFPFLAAAMLRS